MEALETQAQATQEKENAVTKQNMKYTMSSSRGIYLSWLTGRIYSTILADHEKLTIDIKPVKKNMIPYYFPLLFQFLPINVCSSAMGIVTNPAIIQIIKRVM